MLRYQVKAQTALAALRERTARDDGASLVEWMTFAGVIALAIVAVVAVVRTWAIGKANALP